MSNIINEIERKLSTKFNGVLNCEEQRADLFAYVDGNEETITAIDAERIYFDGFNIDLWNADIHTLAYINEVLGE